MRTRLVSALQRARELPTPTMGISCDAAPAGRPPAVLLWRAATPGAAAARTLWMPPAVLPPRAEAPAVLPPGRTFLCRALRLLSQLLKLTFESSGDVLQSATAPEQS